MGGSGQPGSTIPRLTIAHPALLTCEDETVSPPDRASCILLYVRRYVKRRVKEEFHKNSALTGEAAASAMKLGRESLGVIERQARVYQMFGSPVKSVLDSPKR